MPSFTDQVHIQVKSGDGGAGCTSFRREAHVPKGGPDGGDGGRGADIILQTDAQLSSLIDYRYKHHFKAERGTHGQGKRMHGKDGQDMILKVPVGTTVRLLDDNMQPQEEIADLTHDKEQVIVAKGGHGGRGNIHFVTPTRRAPAFSELGEPTEPIWIELEMKLMADAALVGMPSVGKSSLIACMSAARPKIADYPFTTLVPNLGMVKAGDYSFVVADVPGLIEGAAQGKGLGHEFLRHVERSALIIHVVDVTGGFEGRDAVHDYEVINKELKDYAEELAKRPRIVVANKVDVAQTQDAIDALKKRVKEDSAALSKKLKKQGIDNPDPIPFFEVSAVTHKGLDALIRMTAQRVRDLRAEQAAISEMDSNQEEGYINLAGSGVDDAEVGAVQAGANGEHHATNGEHHSGYDRVWEHKRLRREKRIEVTREEAHAWRVRGVAVERMIVQTEWNNEEAVAFLQRRLEHAGVEKALLDAGAVQGDEVRIREVSFDFEPVDMSDPEYEALFAREFVDDPEQGVAIVFTSALTKQDSCFCLIFQTKLMYSEIRFLSQTKFMLISFK